MIRIRISTQHTLPETTRALSVAISALRSGLLVVIPTETFYGLAADAFNPRALARVFKAKGRERRKPLLVLIGKTSDVSRLASRVSPAARRLMRAFWPRKTSSRGRSPRGKPRKASPRGKPGPLTIVLPAKRSLPRELTAGTGTVAIRLTSHPIARALARAIGPITGTSANRSGKSAQRTVAGVMRQLGTRREIALMLDAGPTRGGKPSTIIDVTKNQPRILREGAISRKQILKAISLR